MTSFVIPPLDGRTWPSLGSQVCDFIEDLLVFGPGDLLGEPARLDDEKRAVIEMAYQVYPHGHAMAGRRRFNRVALFWRKGKGKTELAAWLEAVELHHEGPVRCDGFRREGRAWVPVGRPLVDPFIPMLAYTEEQSEELAYGALYAILAASPIADDFDIGLERIMRADGHGKAVALAASPKAREGQRATSAHIDEPHLFVLPRLVKAHTTVLANLPKRRDADAWMLETTTMFTPGEGSVAEHTWDAGQAIARELASGKRASSRMLLIFRGASDEHDVSTDAGLLAAIDEASGPETMPWTNTDGIVSAFRQPDADLPHLRKVWLNQQWRTNDQAFDLVAWKKLAAPEHIVPLRSWITLGFDGSRVQDATALVATDVMSGHQWPIAIWERPYGARDWEVDEAEVDLAVDDAFTSYRVWRLYGDPPYWEAALARWAGKYGKERVLAFATYRVRAMAPALHAYAGAIVRGELTHSGDGQLTAHIGHAVRRYVELRREDGTHMFLIQKERPDSPHKMDGAMAGCLSWQARMDALKEGVARRVVRAAGESGTVMVLD